MSGDDTSTSSVSPKVETSGDNPSTLLRQAQQPAQKTAQDPNKFHWESYIILKRVIENAKHQK
ncbi:hypothetical protein ACFLSX_04225 [Calditrichota bacterium]